MIKSKVEHETADSLGSNPCWKVALVVLIGFQNASTALIGRHTRTFVSEVDLFNVRHFVLLTDVAKCGISIIAEIWNTNGELGTSIHEHVVKKPAHTLKYFLPAALYFIQSTLAYYALTYIDADLFLVIYQCRIVTSALLGSLILGQQLSWTQWFFLVALCLGVATAVVGKLAFEEHANLVIFGLLTTLIACLSTSNAGIYFNLIFQKDEMNSSPSIWVQNFQISFFSIIIALALGVGDNGVNLGLDLAVDKSFENFFRGFTPWVWVLFLLQSAGGLLVSMALQYSNNTMKGIAVWLAITGATMASTLLFDEPLTPHFVVGAVYVMMSSYFFANPLPSCVLPPNDEPPIQEIAYPRRMSVVEMAIMAGKRRMSTDTNDSDEGEFHPRGILRRISHQIIIPVIRMRQAEGPKSGASKDSSNELLTNDMI